MDKPIVAAAPTGKFEWDWELIALLTLFFVLVILGVRVIAWVRSWRQHDNPSNHSPEDELSSYRQLLEQGIIEQAEFERVRARLEQKGRGHPELQPPPEPEGPPPPPAPP